MIFALQFVFGTLFTEDPRYIQHGRGRVENVGGRVPGYYIKVVVVVTSLRKGEVKKKRRRTGCFGRSGPMSLVVSNSSHGPNHPF